ncbi:DUF3997 domain-containing protein [Mucilaginibacter arboris]|uniref:DUF3997 domain-containing protein n=1 Tax=Mucilaginibacter arboris TaxID=2682090 RepID=A0A7K1SZ02_9SPHI|nr:DUF3997 domain-containing protein [Mucilaginibacter arboris]MVN22487.1 DUF3997 domain-containing protein [Mucilaginibacter arboris]
MTTTIKNIILLFLIVCCLTSCLFDSSSNRVTGKYEVLWIDLPENQMLTKESELHSSSSSTIIEPYVFAVGHNEHYIIAKQHPTNGFQGGYKINVNKTNYYILDIYREKDKVFGPLTLKQFDNLRSELNIENIEFDQTYPDSY